MLDVSGILSARYRIATRHHQRVVCTWRNEQERPVSALSVPGETQVAQKFYRGSRTRRCSVIVRARADVDSKGPAMKEGNGRARSSASRRPMAGSALDKTVYENLPDACSSGLPDVDTCTLDFSDENDSDYIARSARLPTKVKQATIPSDQDQVISEAWTRGRWLLGLLILQSLSSVVLNRYEVLLREHLVVTLFLTMLVGAGGNAGNQSAIKVIRGLATGKLNSSMQSIQTSVWQQARVGLVLGTALSAGGFLRVYLSDGSVVNAAAISIALFMIVMTSVVLGSALPFCLSRAGVDPANAGTSIQVVMDIFGVGITCVTCDFVFHQLVTAL